MKKILLLSGYDASSHRYWRTTLEQEIKEVDWTQLSLPDRHFYWRVRSNSLSFAFEHQEILEQDYDLILATSMVDLSSLRGFCPSLAKIPTIVYFHENQFAYPVSDQQPNLVNVQITSIYSALCADKLLFNSNYNRSSFLEGAKTLLKRMPDHVPAGLVDTLVHKAEVMAVPIESRNCESTLNVNHEPHIIWNHRWEYDKQPEVFFDALNLLKASGQAFKLHIVGQSFRNKPDCFERAKQSFVDEILTYGFQSKEDYFSLLENSDIVISSALHDFQGLSIQQAIVAGCTPIAPNRVAYPEYIPQEYLYESSKNPKQEAENLFIKLKQTIDSKNYKHIDLTHYSTQSLIPKYISFFNNTYKH